MGGKPISGRDREAVLSAIRRNGDEGGSRRDANTTATNDSDAADAERVSGVEKKHGKNKERKKRGCLKRDSDGTFEIGGREANLLQLQRGGPHQKELSEKKKERVKKQMQQ